MNGTFHWEPFVPSWPSLEPHRLHWCHIAHIGATRLPLKPHDPHWSHTTLIGATRPSLEPCYPHWSHTTPIGAMLPPLEPHDLHWSHTTSMGATRPPWEPHDHHWSHTTNAPVRRAVYVIDYCPSQHIPQCSQSSRQICTKYERRVIRTGRDEVWSMYTSPSRSHNGRLQQNVCILVRSNA